MPDTHAASGAQLQQQLRLHLQRHEAFEAEDAGSDMLLSRQRAIPSRGIFRLLIPRVIAKVSFSAKDVRYRIRPDGMALFMVLMLAAGVVVEVTMDRSRYPREYPEWFVFVLFGVYVALLIYDWIRTKQTVERALAEGHAQPAD